MKNQILLFLFGIFLFSCSKPVKIDVSEPPRIVIHSFLSPDKLIKVNVSRSFSPMSDEEFRIEDPYCQGCYGGIDTQKVYLMEAKVEIFEDDVLLEQLAYAHSGNFISQYTAKENSTYKLRVKAAGYPSVSAITRVPKKIDIDTIYFSVYSESDQQRIYKAKLTYHTNSLNKYMFTAYSLSTNDLSGELYYGSMYVGDRIEAGNIGNSSGMRTALYWEDFGEPGFKEKKFYFNYYAYGGFGNDTLNFVGVLQNVRESYYLTRKTIEQYDESGYEFGSFFTTPVQLYNNIENGIGSFSAYSSDTLLIKLIL